MKCSLYYQKGYYFDLNDDDAIILFASDVCKKPLSLVKEVIKGCVRRELFDKSVFDAFNVLTSDRVQECYLIATYEGRKKGAVIKVIEEFWLISDSENQKGIVKVREKQDFSRENDSISREKHQNSRDLGTQRKVKESKGKESKEKNSISAVAEAPVDDKKLFNHCKTFFLEFYKEHFKTDYYFQAKDGKKIKDLLKKIDYQVKAKCTSKNEVYSPEMLPKAFEYFIVKSEQVADNWLKSNYNLSNLDSKFNDVFNKIQNGKGKQSGISAAERAFNLYN